MRRLILSIGVCALVALISLAAYPAGAASGSLAFCDTATGAFQVTGSGFVPGAQLVVWTNWDATAGIGDDSRAVSADPTGGFKTTFPATDLPTTVEVTDTSYTPVAGPFTAATIGPCSTTAGQPSVATSTVTPSVNPPQLPADGTSQTTVIVQLKNADRVPLTVGGQAVTVSTTAGTFSGGCTNGCATLDNGDGTYTATLTAPTAPATATVIGYIDGAAIQHTATVDFTQLVLDPPTVNGATGTSTSPVAQFTFSGHAGAVFLCSLDGAPYASCTSPYTTPALADGPHTLAVEQTYLGVTSTSANFHWTVATPPSVPALTATPPSLSASATATFSFSGAASGTTFQCSLDNAPLKPCTSPITYNNLSEGPHSFSVVQVKGGVSSTPATFAWSVDTTPPAAPTLTSGASGTSTSATFAFAGEAGATFQCSLDGAAYAPCTSPVTYTGLSLGAHTFAVEAIDLAGNVGPAATSSWMVTLPPGGCTGVVDVSGGGHWDYVDARGHKHDLHVQVNADCRIDGVTGRPMIHNAGVQFNYDGAAGNCHAQSNAGRAGDVTAAIASGNTAEVRGQCGGQPFDITLTDDGRRDDGITVRWGAFASPPGSPADFVVHIDNG